MRSVAFSLQVYRVHPYMNQNFYPVIGSDRNRVLCIKEHLHRSVKRSVHLSLGRDNGQSLSKRLRRKSRIVHLRGRNGFPVYRCVYLFLLPIRAFLCRFFRGLCIFLSGRYLGLLYHRRCLRSRLVLIADIRHCESHHERYSHDNRVLKPEISGNQEAEQAGNSIGSRLDPKQ